MADAVDASDAVFRRTRRAVTSRQYRCRRTLPHDVTSRRRAPQDTIQ